MPVNPREGQPIWIDYVCQDFEAAQNFYNQLFGWEFTDMGEEFGHYNMITKDGGNVGGAMRAMNMDGTPSLEMPTAWSTYLHTGDIAGVHQAALAAGATDVVGPMPVGPLGQMAVVVDPTGSPIGMWQPGEFAGFDTPLTPGTPVWFELMTTDFAAANDFYGKVFSFDITLMEGFPYSTHIETVVLMSRL